MDMYVHVHVYIVYMYIYIYIYKHMNMYIHICVYEVSLTLGRPVPPRHPACQFTASSSSLLLSSLELIDTRVYESKYTTSLARFTSH